MVALRLSATRPVVLFIGILMILSTFVNIFGCQQQPKIENNTPSIILEADNQVITLEEAGIIIGVPIPTPTYLPKDHQIREVYIKGSTVILLISNEEIDKELVSHAGNQDSYQKIIEISIAWYSGGIPGG